MPDKVIPMLCCHDEVYLRNSDLFVHSEHAQLVSVVCKTVNGIAGAVISIPPVDGSLGDRGSCDRIGAPLL
jgi:hypothetical protein